MRYILGYSHGILKSIDSSDEPSDWPIEMWDWADCEGGGSEYGFSTRQEAFADAKASIDKDGHYRREIRHLKLVGEEYVEIEKDSKFYRSQKKKPTRV